MNCLPHLQTKRIEDGIVNWLEQLEKERERKYWLGKQGNQYCQDFNEVQRKYERGCAEVKATLETKASATCSQCSTQFDYYAQFTERVGNWGPELSPKLESSPPRCLACEQALQNKLAAERSERERLAAEERARLAKEERNRKIIAGFFDRNPSASWYCSEKCRGNPRNPTAYNDVVTWSQWNEGGDEESMGQVITGSSFRGKTCAAYHLMHRLTVEDHEECLAIDSGVLNSIPKLAYESARELRDLMDRLKTVGVLLIDDLDKAQFTPRLASEFWGLVEARLRTNRLPTFITTNTRRKSEFINIFPAKVKDEDGGDAKKIGVSIYNRLVESCQFVDFDL